MSKILWIDTETTGLSAKDNGLTEVACIVEIDGVIKDKLLVKINPFTYSKNVVVEDEALKLTNKSIDILTGIGDSLDVLSGTYTGLGAAYLFLNDIEKAEEYYAKALTASIDFFGEESIGRLNSAIFGSQKRERILEACMNYMRRRHDLKLSVRLGPEIITEVYDDKKFPEVKVFPSEYFYPYNPYRKGAFPKLMYRDITERTMAIHHWEKTWKMNLLQRLLRKIF